VDSIYVSIIRTIRKNHVSKGSRRRKEKQEGPTAGYERKKVRKKSRLCKGDTWGGISRPEILGADV